MTDQPEELAGEWGDPPPLAPKHDWPQLARVLRSKPMRWRKFERERATVPNAIRQGKIPSVSSERGFEIETRNNIRSSIGPRTCTLYIRYNPDKDQTKE